MSLGLGPALGSFRDIEFSPHHAISSHFFIDNASGFPLASALALLIALLTFFAAVTVRAPPPQAANSTYFPITSAAQALPITANLTIGPVHPQYRFLIVAFVLVANSSARPAVVPLFLSVRTEVQSRNRTHASGAVARQQQAFSFSLGAAESDEFTVANEVADFDRFSFDVQLEGSCAGIAGVQFRWRSLGLRPGLCHWLFRVFCTILMAQSLVAFVVSAPWRSEAFTHALLVAVGVAGLFAPNPLGLFPWTTEERLADFLLFAIFTGTYRAFLLLEMAVLWEKGGNPSARLTGAVALGIMVYAMLDVFTSMRWSRDSWAGAPTVSLWEKCLLLSDLCYAGVAAFFWTKAARQGDSSASGRLWFFGLAIGITASVPIATHSHRLRHCLDSLAPRFLLEGIFVALAVASLTVMHASEGPSYASLASGSTALEVEIASSSASADK
jgi:hypothetical protein